MASRQQYDVVVLGAGPGGYVAAIRAAQLGLRTAIVEAKYWGGVCLNVGCVPSKALLRNAEIANLFNRQAADFGIRVEGTLRFDYGAAYRRSRQVADGRANGVRYLMRKNGVDTFDGYGVFTGPYQLQVALSGGESREIGFANAIIATGASPRLLPGTQRSANVVTYEEQILAQQLPASVIIVGAGAIGVEFAYLLASYQVDVTLVETAPRLLPLEDAEVSTELARRFRALGIRMLTAQRVDAVVDTGTGVDVTVHAADGAPQILHADRALQAIGFRPNTTGYGLDSAGVRLADGGAIDIDAELRTSAAHILAIGDVTGKRMLAHVAEAMGMAAAERIAGKPALAIDYDMMPRATFSQPQVASFGFTAEQARERGLEPRVAKFPLLANAKAQGLGDPGGFVKLVSDDRSGLLLGAHMIGHDVSELLPELTLARQWRLKPLAIARNVHAHPTLGEAVMDAAHGLAGAMINL